MKTIEELEIELHELRQIHQATINDLDTIVLFIDLASESDDAAGGWENIYVCQGIAQACIERLRTGKPLKIEEGSSKFHYQCGACHAGRHPDCSGWCFCADCNVRNEP